MKKLFSIVALLVVGISAVAAPKTSAAIGSSYSYGEPFIFVERNVEFAVYPDGQFDFLYHPRGIKISRINPHVNMSYNAGYNYNPYIQFDDFGAVVQIESVPVYYDYYGRIIQAGSVLISYNNFGRISRIGNLMVHYNPYNQYTHYSGFINGYNHRYIPQPWHHFYRPPHLQYAVVFHQPYRAYYYPTRVKYSYHRNYYKKHYNQDFKRSYYRPGDNVVVYHRGRRTENVRDVRDNRADFTSDLNGTEVRSNVNSERDRTRSVRVKETPSRSTSVRRVQQDSEDVRNSRTSGRSENVRTPRTVERNSTAPSRVEPRERVSSGNSGRESRSSSNVQRAPEQPVVKRAEPVNRSSGASSNTNERTSTSRSTRGRG